MSFSWNLSGAASSITQTASSSNVAGATQDGYASGSYQDFSVDGNGIVRSQLQQRPEVRSLDRWRWQLWQTCRGCRRLTIPPIWLLWRPGPAVIGTPGTAGRGTIEDKALESSNVDVSTEFSALIVAQRAFEANSKSVTTFDQATQEAINMIH